MRSKFAKPVYGDQLSCNGDSYDSIGKIWLMAKKHNQQSIIENGAVTCRRSRVVTKYRQLPLT